MKYYLIVIYGDVEAEIAGGPFETEEALDQAALAKRAKLGPEDDGLHWLTIDEDGIPNMGDWSGGFFEPSNEAYWNNLE